MLDVTRIEFLKLVLADLHEGKVCVEVGVFNGEHAQQMLDILKPSKLILIDIWDKQGSEKLTRDRFAGNPNVEIIKSSSELVNVGPVDLVYIDTFHTKHAICRDLNHWWPQVRTGGWLTGHDYGMRPGPPMWIEVEEAVDEFAIQKNRFVMTRKIAWLKEWAIKK